MKKCFVSLAILLISILVFSQPASVIKNYQKGTKAIKSKKFLEGISYLNLSIEEQPTSDTYYNRAVAYYSLGDTCSFCNDLKKASALYDQAAEKLFKEKCTYKVIAKNIPDSLHLKYPSLLRVEATFNLCNNDSTVVFVHENEGIEYESSRISEINQSPVFTIVEEMPEFVGGMEAWNHFLAMNLIYPVQAFRERIEGTVYVSFVIDETGSAIEIKALRGLEGGCTEEAIRIIQIMPKWKPGRQKGKPVRVLFNMPIRFQLNGDEENQINTYYHRALTNLNTGDTCKSCADLFEAQKYGNSRLTDLYELTCFRYDTIREIPDSVLTEIPELSYTLVLYSKCKPDTSYSYFNANNERILNIVETPPEFPGGDKGRMIFLQNTVRYPQEAREGGVQGVVYVTFLIQPDGSVTEATVLTSPSSILSKEAIRVVKLMPKWKPGTQNGKPVRVQFNMSIKFTLGK